MYAKMKVMGKGQHFTFEKTNVFRAMQSCSLHLRMYCIAFICDHWQSRVFKVRTTKLRMYVRTSLRTSTYMGRPQPQFNVKKHFEMHKMYFYRVYHQSFSVKVFGADFAEKKPRIVVLFKVFKVSSIVVHNHNRMIVWVVPDGALSR